jgi:hypothetical protein
MSRPVFWVRGVMLENTSLTAIHGASCTAYRLPSSLIQCKGDQQEEYGRGNTSQDQILEEQGEIQGSTALVYPGAEEAISGTEHRGWIVAESMSDSR